MNIHIPFVCHGYIIRIARIPSHSAIFTRVPCIRMLFVVVCVFIRIRLIVHSYLAYAFVCHRYIIRMAKIPTYSAISTGAPCIHIYS